MKLPKTLPLWPVYALLAYMPFHVFLTQSLSLLTGGLDFWKVAKDVLTLVVLLGMVGMVIWRKLATRLYWWLVGVSAVYVALHALTYFVNKQDSLDVAFLATAYNCRLLAYLIIGYSATLLVPKDSRRSVLKLMLIVSTTVSLLGVLQYFLPKDLLTHVGYSLDRGVRPAFFIDDKPDLPRIMSTLRDPNSLGAYLLVPLALLSRLWLRLPKRRMLLSGLLLLHGLALFLTFSRGAWLGAIVTLCFVGFVTCKQVLLGFAKRYSMLLAALLVLLAGGIFVLRDNYIVQNVVVHSDENTQLTDSNNLHWQLAKDGLIDSLRDPLGHGPGTAGIVSIQNPNGGRLTENYYIQIAYEVGLLGLALFVAVHVVIYRSLCKQDTTLAVGLLAAFWGYVVMNMLFHTWSNEAVAAQWWLLAGMLLAAKSPPARSKRS